MTQEKQLDFPHVESNKNLLIFSGALAILLIVSAFFYGIYVFAIAAVALVSGFIVEWIFAKIRKLELGISWIVSPLVLTLMLPPTIDLWVVSVGAVFGIFFGKAIFGGFGRNVFNPAVVGVMFVTISFPSLITAAEWIHPTIDNFAGATPLNVLNGGGTFTYLFEDLLLGNTPGSIGETFRIGIIILGIGLIVLKVVDWRFPVFYCGGVFVLTGLGYLINPDVFPNAIYSLFVGGLMFAAFFVVSDPVTAPIKPKGRIIYALGLAFFTVLIRNFATFQEGIIFAVILMNAIAPLIDDSLEKKDIQAEEIEEATV